MDLSSAQNCCLVPKQRLLLSLTVSGTQLGPTYPPKFLSSYDISNKNKRTPTKKKIVFGLQREQIKFKSNFICSLQLHKAQTLLIWNTWTFSPSVCSAKESFQVLLDKDHTCSYFHGNILSRPHTFSASS